MFQVREDEPKYAFLSNGETRDKNAHGKFIELVEKASALSGKSLNINGDSGIGDNPNRYKQHGFHFTADNCIACHACEAACSEKNDNPAHLAFRSVGYVEGGTYPAYQRLNISMACNHCDNPVCLKGCPTRAYTKFAEYGAVLQDPDICFGCGYCTWVCPYNAPQLDPIKGQVSKCNMCVDRLEVGLKPACVSACLGGALEFGVIENTPANRDQAELTIPGFPTTEITHPNIRFQQKRSLPREMTRADTMPLKYHRDDKQGRHQPIVDENKGGKRQWNLKKLLTSHENAHIAFTLCAQTVIGAFIMLMLAPLLGSRFVPIVELSRSQAFLPLLLVMFVLLAFGMFKLNMHLGKPLRFYRGFNNLRHSPVSREIAGVSLFFGGFAGFTFMMLVNQLWFELFPVFLLGLAATAAIIGGVVGFYFMYRLYRIPARPFWNHWQTGSAFMSTALVGGALVMAVVAGFALPAYELGSLLPLLAAIIAVGLGLEMVGLVFHSRDLRANGGEGAAALFEQASKYGYSYRLRNGLLVLNLLVAVVASVMGLSGVGGILVGIALALSLLAAAIMSRALFYVLVIPTTMPGAFFWRNRGFEEHARESGLAEMPQVGVVPDHH
ncbi:MAG: dimethyl sulfoxide reductase anchor subunit [Gammaproteobacteria bacterium]|nr:dimethyl sulfoxide reductase anchor subunit [Gammaproteobacteria bacterium]